MPLCSLRNLRRLRSYRQEQSDGTQTDLHRPWPRRVQTSILGEGWAGARGGPLVLLVQVSVLACDDPSHLLHTQ